jgi:hypothetical protein
LKQGANKEILEYMASTWPAAFFSKGIYGLLPIQIIPFGIIGAVLGYWLAIRWKFWWDNHA